MQNEVNSICPASFSLASDYTLTTGSTAVVDAGLPQNEMPVDLAGWYRASPPEIGAFEEPLTDTPSEVCTYTDGRLATRTMGVKTLSYTYDAYGRLTSFADSSDSGNDVTNTYDHLGRRIAMEIGGVEKYRFVYDGEDVIAEYFDSNNDGDVADPDDYKRVYWILPEIDQRVGFLHIQNGTTNFYAYLTDQVGSVLQIVDSDGTVINQYDYDAFGNINPANSFEGIPNRYTFQGREWDANAGHYYFRNRTYIPEWGCFTGPDMNLGNGILGEPNGIGNYLFCENNPLMYRDPLGLRRMISGGRPKFIRETSKLVLLDDNSIVALPYAKAYSSPHLKRSRDSLRLIEELNSLKDSKGRRFFDVRLKDLAKSELADINKDLKVNASHTYFIGHGGISVNNVKKSGRRVNWTKKDNVRWYFAADEGKDVYLDELQNLKPDNAFACYITEGKRKIKEGWGKYRSEWGGAISGLEEIRFTLEQYKINKPIEAPITPLIIGIYEGEDYQSGAPLSTEEAMKSPLLPESEYTTLKEEDKRHYLKEAREKILRGRKIIRVLD